jgi:hypothetical protein
VQKMYDRSDHESPSPMPAEPFEEDPYRPH